MMLHRDCRNSTLSSRLHPQFAFRTPHSAFPLTMLLDDLRWRGLVHQTTDDANLSAWLEEAAAHGYAGFDPTADSLHVGNLVPLLLLRRFQLAGHKPIAVVGGATGMIGDPSGKSQERNLLSKADLEHNVAAIREQMRQFLDFEAAKTPRSSSTTSIGSARSAISNSCATSARTFRST